MTSSEIEIAMYRYLNVRQGAKILVPNISYGLFNHELDLLLLKKSGFANEIEIKISKADIKKDQTKHHSHESKYLQELWFAIPIELKECEALIPKNAGIYTVRKIVTKTKLAHDIVGYSVDVLRPATKRKDAVKFTPDMIRKLCYLTQFRTWRAVEHNIHLKNENNALKKGFKLL